VRWYRKFMGGGDQSTTRKTQALPKQIRRAFPNAARQQAISNEILHPAGTLMTNRASEFWPVDHTNRRSQTSDWRGKHSMLSTPSTRGTNRLLLRPVALTAEHTESLGSGVQRTFVREAKLRLAQRGGALSLSTRESVQPLLSDLWLGETKRFGGARMGCLFVDLEGCGCGK
jgi:hypothetical protein